MRDNLNLHEPPQNMVDRAVYRRGSSDDLILSWTDRSEGAVLHYGTDREVTLSPDRQSTVGGLLELGIVPISGIGANHNFYGEGEITFLNLNAIGFSP